MSHPPDERAGCPTCRATPATQADLRLEWVRNLCEEPHEGYSLFRCPACGQPFLEQFQEITWLPGGEDDIWLRWVPLTPDERAEVERLFPEPAGGAANAVRLVELARRRRLVRDPLGRFAWSDYPDAGNLFPPG
jgi:hypothetical protein